MRSLRRSTSTTVIAKIDRTTGVVCLANGRFVVPPRFAGARATFRIDLLQPYAAIVTDTNEITLEVISGRPLPVPRDGLRATGASMRVNRGSSYHAHDAEL